MPAELQLLPHGWNIIVWTPGLSEAVDTALGTPQFPENKTVLQTISISQP